MVSLWRCSRDTPSISSASILTTSRMLLGEDAGYNLAPDERLESASH